MKTNKSILGMLFIAGLLLVSGCKKDGGAGPLGCRVEQESAAYQEAVEAYINDVSSVEKCERVKQAGKNLLAKAKNCTLANRKQLEEAIAAYEDIDCANQ